MGNETDHIGLQLWEAPQWGQDTSEEGHGQRQLHGRGTVAQVRTAALEGTGVAGTKKAASQRLVTQVRVQTATKEKFHRTCGIEF